MRDKGQYFTPVGPFFHVGSGITDYGLKHLKTKEILIVGLFLEFKNHEALESVMCDVIKKSLKIRIATRSGKGTQPLNTRTAAERPILC